MNIAFTKVSAVLVAVVSLIGFTSIAQITKTSSVLDGSGAKSIGGTLTNISAAGQPGGIAESSGGGFVNQAGFLNTFVLKPGLDTDNDGLVDEIDQDNDNDQLTDITEIAGSAFSPSSPTFVNVADTDSDGIIDGFESVAGTDPNNINAFLQLVAISNSGGDRAVSWLARGNNERTYIVRAATDTLGAYDTVVFSNTVSGGSAPWFAVTTSIAHASATDVRYYAVEVIP